MNRRDREELEALRLRVRMLEIDRRYREPFPWEDAAVVAFCVPALVGFVALVVAVLGQAMS